MTFTELPEGVKNEFADLAGRLSPENLACDGELPRHMIERRFRQLTSRWKRLETMCGLSVTEDEVWDWWINSRSN